MEIEGEKYLVELKSANDKMFYNYLKEPKEQHVDQLQLYMYLAGVHKGFILYENKNDQSLKEFYVEYDQTKVSQLIDKIITVNESVKNKTLPPRDYTKSHWQCRYCDFRALCWFPDSEEAVQLMAENLEEGKIKEKYEIINNSS